MRDGLADQRLGFRHVALILGCARSSVNLLRNVNIAEHGPRYATTPKGRQGLLDATRGAESLFCKEVGWPCIACCGGLVNARQSSRPSTAVPC